MSRDADGVLQAIDRWVDADLIDGDTADRLREEARIHAASTTRRISQYLIASAGGAALLIAGGVFASWAWPRVDVASRATMMAMGGLVALVVGVRLEGGHRWRPPAYLLQTSGLGLLLAGFAYSDGAWGDQTPIGFVVGLLSLGTPIVLAPRALKRNAVMPAVHMAMAFGFMAVFLDRTTTLSGVEIIWVLDGLLLLALVALAPMLLRDPDGTRYPWALNAFVTAMLGGFLLIWWTGVEVLHLSDDVLYPLDLWLGLMVALTVWAGRRGPPGLAREWLGQLLALLMLAWIPLGLLTGYEAVGGPEAEVALLLVCGAGVAGFVHASAHGIRSLMATSTLAFIVGMWVWAIDRGGALGAVAALVATAGLLFWVSGRAGRDTDEPA